MDNMQISMVGGVGLYDLKWILILKNMWVVSRLDLG